MTAARMQKILVAILLPLLSILILSGIANAHPAPTATGTLRGTVAAAAPDGQSYNVPGASLKLKTPTQTLDAVTDDAGEYEFTNYKTSLTGPIDCTKFHCLYSPCSL